MLCAGERKFHFADYGNVWDTDLPNLKKDIVWGVHFLQYVLLTALNE